VGHEAPQPLQLGALFPTYAGYLVGPPRMAQPCPQIVEHVIRNVNPKRFQLQQLPLGHSQWQVERFVCKRIDLVIRNGHGR
jgi:hypothetical protein